MGGALGALVQRGMQLEMALQLGFDVRLSEITCEEFSAVCALREERLKREAEQTKQDG